MPICSFDIAPDGTARPVTEPQVVDGYRWWHFERGDPELLEFLEKEVPAIPAASLRAEETRPRCDKFEDGLILNFRGVNLNSDSSEDQMVAVRMWVTDKLVVTVRVRRVFVLEDLRQAADEGRAPASPLAFATALSSGLMRRIQDTVFDLAERVDAMEDSVQSDDALLPPELAEERRMAIRLRRYLGPQRDALVTLAGIDSPLMTSASRARLREQANTAKLVVEELESLAARMTAVQDHHAAQAALMQGRNGFVLSIVAAVFLPLGFATGLFGVNVAGMPGMESPWAFSALCVALAILAGGSIWVLRRLKWI